MHFHSLVNAIILQSANHFQSCTIADMCEPRIFMTTKISLKNFSIFGSVKQCPPRLQFFYSVRGFFSMQFRHSPVVDVLSTTHGVSKMYFPVITFVNITQCSRNSSFSHYGVGFPKKRFADQTDRNAVCRCFNSSTKTGTTSTDHKYIVVISIV